MMKYRPQYDLLYLQFRIATKVAINNKIEILYQRVKQNVRENLDVLQSDVN